MTRDGLVVGIGMPLGVFLIGVVSGLLPVVNAEAALIAAVLGARTSWLILAAALALGQSTAKCPVPGSVEARN